MDDVYKLFIHLLGFLPSVASLTRNQRSWWFAERGATSLGWTEFKL